MEPGFQRRDFTADSALGQAQFFGGVSEIQVTRGDQKCVYSIVRKGTARHKHSRHAFLSCRLSHNT